jgi:hypothetical protein
MYVRIDNGYELDELHNVLIISGSDGDLLVASGSNGNGKKLYINTKQLTGSYSLTGSLNIINGGVTGSLLGTASYATQALTSSYALTASYALNGGGGGSVDTGSLLITASVSLNTITFTKGNGSTFPITVNTGSGGGGVAFPYTGSAVITGSLILTGSATITNNLTASAALISGSGVSRLTVVGSGSSSPLFTVQGSQGELFSITDSLSGSLFSVNDISGLPVIEAFSDGIINFGNVTVPALLTTVKVTSTAGNNTIYSIPTSSYDGVWFDYTIKSGSNARAGQIMAIWGNGGNVSFTETTTTDIGSTSGVNFTSIISGANLLITGSTSTANWTIKGIVRSI